MTFWVVVVVLSVVSLALYEIYSRYKERNNPPVEPTNGEARAVEVQAELARARMKIAMLESRLEESEARLESSEARHLDDVAALTALEERYRKQLVQTEKAYQRQMVTLSERINGNGRSQQETFQEYPVRMAAEVAAWRASLGGQALVETAVSDDAETLADNMIVSIEAPDSALGDELEETANPKNDQSAPIIGAMAAAAAAANSAAKPNGSPANIQAETEPKLVERGRDEAEPLVDSESDLAEVVVLSGILLEPDEAVLEQVVVLEDAADGADLDDVLNAGEIVVASDVETAVVDSDEAEALAAEPLQNTAADEALVSEEDQAAAADEQDFSNGSVEEIPPLENRWPELESIAMQRVMARHLGSEMDADYLDDEEFMRELGIEIEDFYLGEEPGGSEWVTDPLQEMAKHINGSDPAATGGQDQEVVEAIEPEALDEQLADPMWEEVVFSDNETAWANSEDEDLPEQVPDPVSETANVAEGAAQTDPLTEDEAIAAEVAMILARDPAQDEKQALEDSLLVSDEEDDAPETAVDVNNDGEFPAGDLFDALLAVDADLIEEDDSQETEEPDFDWERERVNWRAEYFNNTKLAGEPVVVRHDRDINFDWMSEPPAKGLDPQTFSVRWSGSLFLEPGQYRFMASAPDGLRLWLNDRLVLSAWYDQSEQTYQRDFAWSGGTMDARVEHYENGGSAKAFLTWERVG